jgi:AraC family transcriptional regulator, transcriptional activator of pobA
LRPQVKKYDFYKTKYGDELLIDLIRLESLEKYITEGCPHSLTYYDITLISKGRGRLSIDHFDFSVQPGKVIFSSPGQIRDWQIKSVPKGFVLIFEEEFLSLFMNNVLFVRELSYFNTSTSPPGLKLSNDDNTHLIKLMENIKEEIETFRQNDKYILQALLYQVLVWLDRKYMANHIREKNSPPNLYIRNFIHLVNQEFCNQQNVAFYAEALNITAGHLGDLCKQHLGVSAKKYIINRIITEAKRLLKYSNMSVNEIACELNYDDPSYFVRFFKAQTGFTPAAYKRKKNP